MPLNTDPTSRTTPLPELGATAPAESVVVVVSASRTTLPKMARSMLSMLAPTGGFACEVRAASSAAAAVLGDRDVVVVVAAAVVVVVELLDWDVVVVVLVGLLDWAAETAAGLRGVVTASRVSPAQYDGGGLCAFDSAF